MAVSKWNSHAIGSKITKAVNGICGETGFGLLAIRYHRRTYGFEAADGVPESGLIECFLFPLFIPSCRYLRHRFYESLCPGNASYVFGRDHRSSLFRANANYV